MECQQLQNFCTKDTGWCGKTFLCWKFLLCQYNILKGIGVLVSFVTPKHFSQFWHPFQSSGCGYKMSLLLSDDPGTHLTYTAELWIAGLVSYPLDNKFLVKDIILELPDKLWDWESSRKIFYIPKSLLPDMN
jgi:hypothetical protein